MRPNSLVSRLAAHPRGVRMREGRDILALRTKLRILIKVLNLFKSNLIIRLAIIINYNSLIT